MRSKRKKKPAIDTKELDRTLQFLNIEKQVISLHKQGHDAEQISEILRLPLTRIQFILNLQKLAPSGRHAATLFQEGHSVDEIASLLGYAPHEISTLLMDVGLMAYTSSSDLKQRPTSPPHADLLRQQVVDLCRSTKMNYQQIAAMMGIPRRTINRWCRKVRGPRHNRLSATQLSKIKKLRKEGWSWQRISAKYQLSISNLKKQCGRFHA